MNTLKNICSNCGNSLRGRFCHACGQQANEPRRAVVGLVQDVFVDTMWIDSRLWRSIIMLFRRPGRLARYYLDGRRVHYSPPFRLFLFASVFFFFFAFMLIGNGGVDGFLQGYREPAVTEHSTPDPGTAPDPASETPPAQSEPPAQTDPQENDYNTLHDAFASTFEQKDWEEITYEGPDWAEPITRQIYEAGQRVSEDPRLFLQSVRANLPRVMLLAPVFYALVLALLYVYRWNRFLFYDHLIVSLYMHAALYAYLLAMLVADRIPLIGGLISLVILVWALLQPYAVFRQAYGSGWVSVIAKGFISTTLYAIFVIVLITFGLSYSLYVS